MKYGFKDLLMDTERTNYDSILGTKLTLGIVDSLSDGFKDTVGLVDGNILGFVLIGKDTERTISGKDDDAGTNYFTAVGVKVTYGDVDENNDGPNHTVALVDDYLLYHVSSNSERLKDGPSHVVGIIIGI